jgi:hypothetical protein
VCVCVWFVYTRTWVPFLLNALFFSVCRYIVGPYEDGAYISDLIKVHPCQQEQLLATDSGALGTLKKAGTMLKGTLKGFGLNTLKRLTVWAHNVLCLFPLARLLTFPTTAGRDHQEGFELVGRRDCQDQGQDCRRVAETQGSRQEWRPAAVHGVNPVLGRLRQQPL